MTKLVHTPVEIIPKIHAELRATFSAGTTRPLAWRRAQLLKLAQLVRDNEALFKQTLLQDLNKPDIEVHVYEILGCIGSALGAAAALEEWAADTPCEPQQQWQKTWNPRIQKCPKGVALIISPWNYPLALTLNPLVGAIAAGCAAVVKPSEMVPAFSNLLAELFPKYLDQAAYRVVNGGVPEATAALELQWDHIFYTGNGRVARIVAAAAAKHLTPLTLELGGKSPVVIDANVDLNIAAKRVLQGKVMNAGQTCVAPDYVLVHKDIQAKFIEELKEAHTTFFPKPAFDNSTNFPSIISEPHQSRLKSLLQNTQGDVIFGGNANDKKQLEVTIVKDVKGDDTLMDEEIFGPILPLLPIESIDEALEYINKRPHPLALYVFTDDEAVKQKFVHGTQSGGLVFNDVFSQLTVPGLPFGGIGESGYGLQGGKYTFEAFTHFRSTVDVPASSEPYLQWRYRPYTAENLKPLGGGALPPIPGL